MISPPAQYVVDASVGIKLFLPEGYSDKAQSLFDLLGDSPPARLYVPDLFYIECTNILWKCIWQTGYAVEDAQQDLLNLRALALRSVSTAELISVALNVADTWAISAYDACYVALSGQLRTPLITADRKLVKKFVGTKHLVQWLGNFLPLR